MNSLMQRSRAEQCLLVVMVLFTVMMFFPAVPSTVPGKLKVAGAVITIVWLLAIWRSDRPPLLWREHPWIAGAAFGFAAWTVASALWATDRATAVGAAGRMALGIALMVVVYTVARDRSAARALIFGYIAGGLLSAAYGVVLKPGNPIPGNLFDPSRLYGGMGEPNDMGAVLLPAIAMGLFTLPFIRNKIGRLILCLAVVGVIIGLFLSQSRGGLVAAVVMLIAGVLLAGRLRAKVASLCGAAVLVAVGYYIFFAPAAIHQRVTSLLRINAYGGFSDGSGRKELWIAAIGVIKDEPLLGVGARNYRTVTGKSRVVHNTYLEIQAELGVIGTLLFLAVIIGAIVVSLRAIRNGVATGDLESEFQARGALCGVFGLLAAYFFISGEFQPQFWWLLGLALACGGPSAQPPEVSAMPESPSADTELGAPEEPTVVGDDAASNWA